MSSRVLRENASPVWLPLAEGISYREFHLEQPNHLYVACLERNNLYAILDTSIGNGDFSSGLETVRGMANRYDQTLNYWGKEWGARNQVVVAINGFFYDPQTGLPWSGQVSSGWYARRFDERESGSGLVWTMDRNIFIGACIVHPPGRQVVRFMQSGKELLFDSLNSSTEEDEMVIFTPQFGAFTSASEDGLEALVQLDRPLMIMPTPAMVTGVIREIRVSQGKTPIPFDHIVLSASGSRRDELQNLARVGQEIGISQELKHYQPDCKTANPINRENVYAATGGSFVFLQNGVIQRLNEDLGAVLRSPRTAIAYNDQYIFFMVVDGRDPFRSLGMSMVELGVFAKTMLGAVWGVAMDGGGSSAMVVKGKLMNHPNTDIQEATAWQLDGGDKKQFIAQTITLPSFNLLYPRKASSLLASGVQQVQEIERAVANGWMMLTVQPKEQSALYHPGDAILVEDPQGLDLRLGPGDNYGILSVIALNASGVIVEHNLNGIFARGTFWWKVNFGDVQGWVDQAGIAISN